MMKVAAALCGLLFLQGCALPLPIQIAAWAIDGVSLLTTRKSITDHGLSMVAGEDCALWRGLAGNAICIGDDPGAVTLVAENGEAVDADPDALPTFEMAAGEPVDTAAGEPVDTAVLPVSARTAGDTSSRVVLWLDPPQPASPPKAASDLQEIVAAWASFPRQTGRAVPVATAPSAESKVSGAVRPAVIPAVVSAAGGEGHLDAAKSAVPVATPGRVRLASGARAPSGTYYVIGSFRDLVNARQLAERHGNLTPSVVTAALDGAVVFRVVVGPYSADDRHAGRRLLFQAGIYDAWAITLDPDEWRVARTGGGEGRELASAEPALPRVVTR